MVFFNVGLQAPGQARAPRRVSGILAGPRTTVKARTRRRGAAAELSRWAIPVYRDSAMGPTGAPGVVEPFEIGREVRQ
jgi:hypothetical protein